MIPVKIQCGCGQRYAFDVEPDNGTMPVPVACPACGADGTAAANECIALTLAAQPAPTPVRIASVPPPPPTIVPRLTAMSPRPQPPVPQKAEPGKDGWATEENSLNKLGIYITVIPAILAAGISWGMFGIEVPAMILFVVVAICGVVGGVLNVAGRGPIVAGALVGLCIAVGGYGAVFWWIHNREGVYTVEVGIAFAIGAAPGLLLQYVIQQILKKRARART
jgi:hypothetical protein